MLGLLAAVGLLLVELLKSVPANLRVHRTGSAAGYSDASLGILLGVAPAWIALGVLSHAPAVTVACVVWTVLHLALCVQVSVVRPSGALRLWSCAAATWLLLVVVVLVGARFTDVATSLGATIALSTLLYGWPALVAGTTSPSTEGLSVISLGLKTAEGFIYLVAGLGVGLLAPAGHFVLGFFAYGVLAIGFNAPVLVRTTWHRMGATPSLDLEAELLVLGAPAAP